MLSLKGNLNHGSLAGFSLKVNLFLDRKATLDTIKKHNILLDNEAIKFIKTSNNGQGRNDMGCMEFDYKGPGYLNLKKFQEIDKKILPFQRFKIYKLTVNLETVHIY